MLKNTTFLATLPFFALSTFAASAQEVATKPLPVVISAYRVAQPIDKVGSAITVITADEIKRSGKSGIFDVLKLAPGINISRNGGFGATSYLRLRGADAGNTLVYIDGAQMSDATSIGNEFDFNGLLVEVIERIEVLRGPQSSLYGSAAVGGVINIYTKRGAGKPQFAAMLEGGSYNTKRQGASVRGSMNKIDYSLGATHFKTGGFSRVTAGNEDDGTEITETNVNLGSQITDNFALGFTGGYSHLNSEFDPSTTVDGPGYSLKDTLRGKVSANLQTFERTWGHLFSVASVSTDRKFDDPLGFFRASKFDALTSSVQYQSNLKLRTRDVLTGGIEYLHEDAKSVNLTGGVFSADIDTAIATRSVFGQYLLGVTENLTVTVGGRIDDHDQTGKNGTYRFTGAYNIPETNTTLRGSYGTSFKSPTLYQLYSIYGDATLQAEESKGYDIGIDRRFLGDRVRLGVTGFHNSFTNLVDFNLTTFKYGNVAQATTRGVETTGTFLLTPETTLTSSYTWLDAVNDQNDRTLARRPKHTGNVGVEQQLTDKLRAGVSGRYVSRQRNANSGSVMTKSYTVFDANGSYDVDENFTLYTNVDNLLDRDYQEVKNFNSSGFAVYVGVRAKY